MLYYNIGMADHHHHAHAHHHHHAGEAHPPALVRPSLLRLSIGERLGLAAVLIALIWAAAYWAMNP